MPFHPKTFLIFQFLFNQRMGEVLAKAGHNVTLIRLQTMASDSHKKMKTPDMPGMSEWVVNGFLDTVDYEWVKQVQSDSAFKDESIWSFFHGEKRKMLSAMMDMFTGACESKFFERGVF